MILIRQVDVCSATLMDVIHAVIHGTDGSVFCFGHHNLGKLPSIFMFVENFKTIARKNNFNFTRFQSTIVRDIAISVRNIAIVVFLKKI